MIDKFDVVVVGGGIIGQTCALALAQSQIKVALIDPNIDSEITATQALRVSAINQASVNAFKALDVWHQLADNHKAAYTGMEVWDKNSPANIAFSCEDNHADALGYIVENHQLEQVLLNGIKQQTSSHLYADKVIQLNQDDEQTLLQLANGQLVQAKLLVVADGAESKLRDWLDIPLSFSDYGQKAIVAKVKTQQPHQGIARQVFTPYGPLAFLPLSEPDRVSIVWSQTSQVADDLMGLDAAAFNKKLAAAFDCIAGTVELESERLAFPLKMRYAQSFMAGPSVLIGDAAHTIHPLAGQGANLGILDALAVAENVSQSLTQTGEINLVALKQVTRWRQAEAMQRIVAMQAFKQGFGNDLAPIKLLRGLAMNLVDKTPFIKQKCAALAMGTTGKLPELAQARY